MKISSNKRRVIFFILFLCLFSTISAFSEEPAELSPRETIRHYRAILERETDHAKMAEAHYKIGLALEKLGRETEATSEYLKIIINYPEVKNINKGTERRLADLYSGFSEKSRALVSSYEEPEKEKDPTIFFAYIKSLYENYRNLGQYDRALNVLERLYDMDSENPAYIVDIGGIYLHGYNDADKAILHFKKALELDSRNPRIYAELGRAYEKKEDYDSAINVYTKAAEISPANPWAIYGLRRIEGIRLAKEKKLVKDWYFMGPFDNSDKKGLARPLPPEKRIDLGAMHEGKNGAEIKWLRTFDYDASGYVDLNMLFEPNDYVVAYALNYIYSAADRKVQFRLGSEDGVKVWLNNEEVLSYEAQRSAELDSNIVPVNLKKGWNKILIKVSDTWGSWGFYFRVTDLNGNPVEDLIFDPLKNDKRLKDIYGKLKMARRFRFTKIALAYTFAMTVFLLGLYFMISNIRNKVKINRMKEDFISSVSHELKTPIAAIKMLAETLKMGRLKHEARKSEYYSMIMRESDRLTRFINKILDFSKIEKGAKIFYFEKTNIGELAKKTIDLYKDEVQDENLKIRSEIEKKDAFAEVDKDAIFQVIFNLMDNAYKYSKDDKDITVSVRSSEKEVTIEVADKGMGISKDNLDKIFGKFYRADRDIVKGIKGSGLGLAFVKSIVNDHDGKIAAKSELGKGSKFIIILPTERCEKGG